MSNWLVTLAHQCQRGSEVEIAFNEISNCFAKFKGEYPTQDEINTLLENNAIEEKIYDYRYKRYKKVKRSPKIIFMQKLEEVEE